jgi:hypothetical protein
MTLRASSPFRFLSGWATKRWASMKVRSSKVGRISQVRSSKVRRSSQGISGSAGVISASIPNRRLAISTV